MEKKHFLLFVIAYLLLFSCSNNEDKISSAFKTYVSSNFDNPNDLEEIISIEPTDTISKTSILEHIDELKRIREECDSVNSILLDSFRSLFETSLINGEVYKLTKNETFGHTMDNNENLAYKLLDIENSLDADYYYDELLKTKDTVIIRYDLKCRVNSDDKLKLKTFKVASDTLLTTIKFNNADFTSKELGVEDLYDYAEKLSGYYNKTIEYQIELSKNYRKQLFIMDSEGIKSKK